MRKNMFINVISICELLNRSNFNISIVSFLLQKNNKSLLGLLDKIKKYAYTSIISSICYRIIFWWGDQMIKEGPSFFKSSESLND